MSKQQPSLENQSTLIHLSRLAIISTTWFVLRTRSLERVRNDLSMLLCEKNYYSSLTLEQKSEILSRHWIGSRSSTSCAVHISKECSPGWIGMVECELAYCYT